MVSAVVPDDTSYAATGNRTARHPATTTDL